MTDEERTRLRFAYYGSAFGFAFGLFGFIAAMACLWIVFRG